MTFGTTLLHSFRGEKIFKERERLKYLDIEGRVILKWIIRKSGKSM
jgi:hypothetical protein